MIDHVLQIRSVSRRSIDFQNLIAGKNSGWRRAQAEKADDGKQSEEQQAECSDKDTALHLCLGLETVGHSLIQNFWQRPKRRLKLRRRVHYSSKETSGLRFGGSRNLFAIGECVRGANARF